MTKYKKNELIEKEIVRRIIDSPRTKQQMLDMLESIEPIIQNHTKNCKECEYETAAFMPCNACDDNGSEFKKKSGAD